MLSRVIFANKKSPKVSQVVTEATSYSGQTDDISVRLHLQYSGAEAKLAFSLSLPS